MNHTQTNGNENIFLATTALEEFWDTTKPIVFLGEWCLRYSRRSFWESVDGEVMDSPFSKSEKQHEAYQYVNDIYERALTLLGEAMNSIHGTGYSNRYWRIVIGPWLYWYVSVVYDRYACLKAALDRYPDFETVGLSETAFVTPSSTIEFVQFSQEDSFNLQIYTKILGSLGKSFPRKEAKLAQHPSSNRSFSAPWKDRLRHPVEKIMATVGNLISPSIALKASYFSKPAEIQLMLKTGRRLLPLWGQVSYSASPKNSSDLRDKLKQISLGQGKFEECLSAMLFSDMPTCFIEGYKNVCSDAEKFYPKKIKAIFSATAWSFDEYFKHWAALSADRGTLLLGAQHGGNYGGQAMLPNEDHETAIADYYYSWGWKRTDCVAKVIPMPATKLLGRKIIGASNLKPGILLTVAVRTRYLLQLSSLPKYFQNYLSWHCRFAKTLSKEIMASVRVRPQHADFGWDITQRLKESFPSVPIETWEVSFQESLANCRLYVCDDFSTTFAEALAANRPTILFWDPQINELRHEARPYYDLLRKNGILFDTPEDAGAAVNRVYDDVEAWWNEPERQAAIQAFCEQFARTSSGGFDLWAAEFKRIANEAHQINKRI